jgi:hypothetical protein
MLRPTVGIALALATVTLAVAQDATTAITRKTFDFKHDALGEDFDQFSSRHTDVGVECSGDADLLAKHGIKDKYEYINRSVGGPRDTSRTLSCSLKGPKQTVAGAEARSVDYNFFDDKLYEIDIRTYGYGGDAYRNIKAAYVDRFGEPRKVVIDTYQNGFGAISHGEHVIWTDPNHPYTLTVTDEANHEAATVKFVDTSALDAIEKLRPKKTADT